MHLWARWLLWLHKHTSCGHEHVWSVGTGKLVYNRRKSVLTESVLTVLSHIEIKRNSAGTRKKVYQPSIRCNEVLLYSLEIWRMASRNCCISITLRLIHLNNLDFVIDKYQTGVLSTTCYSLTDADSDWTLIVCSGVLSQRLSSWLTNVHSRSFCGFFDMVTVNIFLSANKNDANTPWC